MVSVMEMTRCSMGESQSVPAALTKYQNLGSSSTSGISLAVLEAGNTGPGFQQIRCLMAQPHRKGSHKLSLPTLPPQGLLPLNKLHDAVLGRQERP